MARFLDGQVIKPGQTFSFNKRVGPRTPERGFKEGQAIVGGLLLPSIGGGVCQVATTVFDAAFYAALPIKSRVNHAWYISHYAMGMDATVADGGPDLVFKNDIEVRDPDPRLGQRVDDDGDALLHRPRATGREDRRRAARRRPRRSRGTS